MGPHWDFMERTSNTWPAYGQVISGNCKIWYDVNFHPAGAWEGWKTIRAWWTDRCTPGGLSLSASITFLWLSWFMFLIYRKEQISSRTMPRSLKERKGANHQYYDTLISLNNAPSSDGRTGSWRWRSGSWSLCSSSWSSYLLSFLLHPHLCDMFTLPLFHSYIWSWCFFTMMCVVLLEFTIKISECYADLPEICKRYEYDYKKNFPSLIFLSGVLIVQGNLRKRRKKIMRIVLTQCHAGFVGRSPFTFWSQRKLVVSHHQLFPGKQQSLPSVAGTNGFCSEGDLPCQPVPWSERARTSGDSESAVLPSSKQAEKQTCSSIDLEWI